MDELRGILCLGGALVLFSCDRIDESYDDPYDGEIELRRFTYGGNGPYIGNGLLNADVSGLNPAHALSSGGLSTAALADPALATTIQYAVECALPDGASITRVVDGKTVVLEGVVGLAPAWETEACDEDCQEWVSACLLARTNVEGNSIQIAIIGDHETLSLEPPAGASFEAAFYGNLFTSPSDRFLCKGSALTVVQEFLDGRTCSVGAGKTCDFTAYNNCSNHSRCTYDGPKQVVPTNCKAGMIATSAPYHTIVAYVDP